MKHKISSIKNKSTARGLLDLTESFQDELILELEKSRTVEDEEVVNELKLVTGNVLAEIGSKILFPIYRKFPDMTPDSLKELIQRDVQP